jgi:hypothetical protein
MRLFPCVLALGLSLPLPLAAWGRAGHKLVAALALRDLPADLAPWFQGREAVLRDHCNDPDDWKDTDPLEKPRHSLFAEPYGGPDQVPWDIQDAMARLGPDAFQQDGQVLWVIQDRVRDLTAAFRGGDADEAAYRAAILCHYVGDLNVPTHTTVNHNGKRTGQHGVNKRWEIGLVDRLGPWEPEARPAALGGQGLHAPWAWLQASFALVAPLLRDDLAAGALAGPGRPGPAADYWTAFARLQMPVVKEQLNRAGQDTAEMILLAWTLAGEPAAP